MAEKKCVICGGRISTPGNGKFCDKCKHPKCLICGKELELKGSRMTLYKQRGWITCSKKCGAAATKKHLMENEGIENVSQRIESRNKISKKTRERYTKYSSEERKKLFGRKISEEEKAKRRRTCMEKYGVSSVLCLPEIHSAGIQAALSDDVKEKRSNAARRNNNSLKRMRGYIKKNPNATISELADNAGVSYSLAQHNNSVFHLGANKKESYLESLMCNILDNLGIDYERRNRRIIKPKEVDFWIPDSNLAIEVNDVWTHNSTNVPYGEPRSKSYHYDKFKLAQDNGVSLFHVWEWQLRDESKRKIISSMIAAKCGKIKTRIYARKCKILKIENSLARDFCESNHLQGWERSAESYGLEYNGELVSVICFNKNELTRFCSMIDTVVVGGFQKLLKISNKKDITTFSFNDYSSGDVYKNCGFKFSGEVAPRYWWVNGSTVLNRRSCQKEEISKRFPGYYDYSNKTDKRTERELMEGLGFVQVFDSGKMKWTL